MTIKRTLSFLMFAGLACAGQRQATLSVSAVVRPFARVEVQSMTSVTVSVTMAPGVQVLVWPGEDSCSQPENSRVISTSGIHALGFSAQEVLGKTMVCLSSSDGLLRSSSK
jgi:hypothetical protein